MNVDLLDSPSRVNAPADAPPSPDAPCAHCELPVGRYPAGHGPYFCCTGCAVVYAALHDAGFDRTFYRLRDIRRTRDSPRPAGGLDPLILSELDSDAFLDTHTQVHPDGSRAAVLFLDGVHCAACVWLVERLPFELDGVAEARLDLVRARLSIRWDPGRVRLSDVARWLTRFGYAAYPLRDAASPQQSVRTAAERRLLVKVGICWALAGNIMLIAFTFYAGLDLAADAALATAARWLSLALAVPALAIGGSEFFVRAWASVRLSLRTHSIRPLHMDTPIALGLLVGFADSARATWLGQGDIWFDSIAVLIAALLTARWLQLRSRRLAGDASERLLALIPSMVRRLHNDGTEEAVRAEVLLPGDRIRVLAGEVVPVDGAVVDGASTVNNAVLTGESRPEAVAPGDAVSAGATNLRGPLVVQVEAAGARTRVGQLLDGVRDAADHRAPVVLLADRLGGVFVAVVLVLALGTALLWGFLAPDEAARHVVALLVITCPCALGMATPLALTVAAGKATRAGIFIKHDDAVERLTHTDALVLDKTGTLTEGGLTLVEWEGSEAAVDLAADLEAHSTHPIATALAGARRRCPVTSASVEAFEAVAGAGVQGRIDGRFVIVGRPGWVLERIGEAQHGFEAAFARSLDRGHTPVLVAVDGRPAALLAFGDRLRAEAPDVLAALRGRGVDVYLLSGDHPAIVRRVAADLSIPLDRALGHVAPEAKRAFVEGLQAAGCVVAMVGDGVNDAAALQAADVGVAVEGGSTASLVAADVFLTRAGLRPVEALFRGTRRVMRVVRRNLEISLVYNVLGATAAMAGLVNPLVAAVAMPISSLLVVASSILQRSFADANRDVDRDINRDVAPVANLDAGLDVNRSPVSSWPISSWPISSW